jgi:type IV pilus assembly protein PilN
MATRINLLPWREERRKQQQRNFILMMVVAVFVATLGVFLTHLQIQALISSQEVRNEYLRGEITRLKKAEAEIKELDRTKARLLGRLEVIQNLQTSRPSMVRIFDTLVRLLPENLYLTSLKSEANQLTLKGVANSDKAISDFMRNLTSSPWFGEPVLELVKTETVNGVRASVFEMVVNRPQPQQSDQPQATEQQGSEQ